MGRQISRGLELSFKPVRGGRGRGRWYKIIGGKANYFGWGEGVSDREGYRIALSSYHAWQEAKTEKQRHQLGLGLTRRLQQEMSVVDVDADLLDLTMIRARIETLQPLRPAVAETFTHLADLEEKRRLIETLQSRPLADLRDALEPKPQEAKIQTVGELLDEFLSFQRERMDRRRKLDKLREQGQAVREAAKQNISAARFVCIARDVELMKQSVGSETWDGTEAGAHRIIRIFREESDALVLGNQNSPHTFNDRIKVARMFCAWAEANYRLDRLPRDRALFAKYSTAGSTAKAIPLKILQTLWKASDDRGRCWILLSLNCAYYAQDISNLTVEMVRGAYLHHERAKTGIKVRYKLWKKTKEYLNKLASTSGRFFATESGGPLLHYSENAGKLIRVAISTWS